MGFKTFAKQGKRVFDELITTPYNFVKDSMVSITYACQEQEAHLVYSQKDGTARPSMVADYLAEYQSISPTEEDEATLAEVAASVYGGKPTQCSSRLIAYSCITQAGAETVSIFQTTQSHLSNSKLRRQTSTTLLTFLMVLALHPDIQKKAQAELDAVTSNERLPNFADRPHLPYIEAVCKVGQLTQSFTVDFY